MKTLQKVNPLGEQDFKTQLDALRNARSIESEVAERADYVIRKIAEIFRKKIDWWSFPNSSEKNGEGVFEDAIDGDIFQYEGANTFDHDDAAIIDGSEFGFDQCQFPIEWLYEDFEQKLVDGIDKYRKQQLSKKELKKEKAEKKKIEKMLQINKIKEKLTEKELKLLNL